MVTLVNAHCVGIWKPDGMRHKDVFVTRQYSYTAIFTQKNLQFPPLAQFLKSSKLLLYYFFKSAISPIPFKNNTIDLSLGSPQIYHTDCPFTPLHRKDGSEMDLVEMRGWISTYALKRRFLNQFVIC